MSTILSKVKVIFSKYPFFANVSIYGALYSSAEIVNQTITKKILPKIGKEEQKNLSNVAQNDSYDWKSVGRYSAYGITILGPSLHFWFKFIDRVLPGVAPKTIIKKVLIDQFCFGFSALGLFFITMNVLEGKEKPFEGVQEKWITGFKFGMGYWIPVQAINFFVLSPQYRVVYVGVMSFIWSNFLIYMRKT
ncbi:Mpv17-like protein [Nymphon striatum]|nr:Mpv17-like protein [Nymphon striatum]